MKVVQINATCGVGSTGKICVGISRLLTEESIENYILYSSKSNGYENGIKCSSDRYVKLQALRSRVFGNYGFNSKWATKKMIYELRRIDPDIVNLHNIHGHDCDIEMLISYFKERNVKVIWTFHDCWAFTGYCMYFDIENCDRWKTGCFDCPQRREYSWLFDKSSKLFEKKRRLLDGLDLTIVTPSQWLADIVKQSFLKDKPISVINNGIDLSVFKPSESTFVKNYGLEGKNVVLGVSFDWDKRKGLDVFIDLSKRLSDDYRIVLVGTNEETDKILPENIISIHRTQNQKELAEIYSVADVFVNPTREENYPTVNMEAIACGAPVLTFRTGGSPEMLDDSCGAVVERNDVDTLEREIVRICKDKPYTKEGCINRSKEFDENERFKEYIKLYEGINAAGAQGN